MTRAKRVDFRRDPLDRAVKEMTRHKFTIDLQAKHTGYTPGQIGYRRWVLRGKPTGVMAFRRGISPQAKAILARLDRALAIVKALRVSTQAAQRRIRRA